jgi:hypothetical protein
MAGGSSRGLEEPVDGVDPLGEALLQAGPLVVGDDPGKRSIGRVRSMPWASP